jgi:hypothetical protein
MVVRHSVTEASVFAYPLRDASNRDVSFRAAVFRIEDFVSPIKLHSIDRQLLVTTPFLGQPNLVLHPRLLDLPFAKFVYELRTGFDFASDATQYPVDVMLDTEPVRVYSRFGMVRGDLNR